MSRAPEKSWWAEALAIARRHGRGGPSDAAEDLAQDLALATLERARDLKADGELQKPFTMDQLLNLLAA